MSLPRRCLPDTCLHDITTDTYYDIHWLNWSRSGAGGFAYSRDGITAQPDATLRELREVLKTSAGLATIWRAVSQLDLTVKKNRSRRRTTTG